MNEAQHALDIVRGIRLVLGGKPSRVQGAVLADLVAIWLAGHHVPGDAAATQTLRTEMLAMQCSEVWKLVPLNAHILGTEA